MGAGIVEVELPADDHERPSLLGKGRVEYPETVAGVFRATGQPIEPGGFHDTPGPSSILSPSLADRSGTRLQATWLGAAAGRRWRSGRTGPRRSARSTPARTRSSSNPAWRRSQRPSLLGTRAGSAVMPMVSVSA